MEDSEYIDGSPSTGYFLYNDLEYDTIDFDTVYIDLPLSGSRVIEFPMINDDTDGDEYKYIIVYEILDTNGSYVPNGNEDTSTYAVN